MTDSQRAFATPYSVVRDVIQRTFGVRIHGFDLGGKDVGDLDGASIFIDDDVAIDVRLATLLHLFGHTVQWHQSALYRELGALPLPRAIARFPEKFWIYERMAWRYGLRLVIECGLPHLGEWLRAAAREDEAMLRAALGCGQPTTPLPALEPAPIPAFRPYKFRRRAPGSLVVLLG
jgi:hypothetical protein